VKKYVSVGADAVIVGSANIKIMENMPISKLEKAISSFTKKLKSKTR
jgi:tryptophan synthase alpha subunit